MKQTMTLAGILLAFTLCLESCGNSKSDSNTTIAENGQQKNSNCTWQYYKHEDDLTNNVTSLYAVIYSTNSKVIDTDGHKAKMYIELRYQLWGTNDKPSTVVSFAVTDGEKSYRFSDYQSSGFLAVFDENEVDTRWSLIDMSKDYTVLFIDNRQKVSSFVESVKKSKKAKFQVNLENAGNTTFEFDIEGLDWEFEN
jgi:hypothetical protein